MLNSQNWLTHLDPHQYDLNLLTTAYAFAKEHDKQDTVFSISTLTQGLMMAETLMSLQCDSITLAAALLYPVIYYKKELMLALEKKIDPNICKIILGALQIDSIHHIQTRSNQVERLRKMLLAMVDDIRTILLKLAERLFLLKYCDAKSQQKIAQETLDFYAPLANRLGIGHLKWQLEDWAFQYINPIEYQKISNALQMRHEERIQTVHKMIAELKKLLAEHHIKQTTVTGRIKHIYSIYQKILRKKTPVEKIYDASAVRILLPEIKDCYTALSIVHHQWTPITEEFDDYIAHPKPNGYRSIHTAILHQHKPIEIQIRTVDMHKESELGIAAHWKYKEKSTTPHADEQKIVLLRELLDWQHAISTMDSQKKLYRAAFHDRVYVFSPNGDVYDLETGSTPLDFAYLVHTHVGHRCKGAKVNGALVSLTHTLATGDKVEILTAKEDHPSRDWLRKELGYMKTLHAIRKVRQWFYKEDIEKTPHVEEKPKSTGELIHEKPLKKTTPALTDFSVAGTTHLLTQLARCCHPIPGDPIMGFITKGRGITVHQKKCHNILYAGQHNSERLIAIDWQDQLKKNYRVELEIQGADRAGLLRDITSLIAKLAISILSLTSRVNTDNNLGIINVILEVSNLNRLDEIMKNIRSVKDVIRVMRK